MLTMLRHPQVVGIQDYFVFKDKLCLVFELLSSSLFETLQRTQSGLSLNLTSIFIGQTLKALEHLAAKGIMHADVKPENILLQSQSKAAVKLIDLGSACFEGH